MAARTLFLVLAISPFACSSAKTPDESGGEAAITPSMVIQTGGGLLGALCTETTGNPLGKVITDLVAGSALPNSDMAGEPLCAKALAQSNPTNECKDYCETRNPQGTTALAATILSYASFNTYIPAETYTKIASLITSPEATPSDTAVGLVQCASLVAWAATEFYFAGTACARGSQCVTCDDESTAIRSSCLIGQTALWCAQALGFQANPALSAISASCTVGRLCNKGIVLEGCRRSCAASLPLAAPIKLAETTPQGVTTRRCCMCDRSTWEDRPWYDGGDNQIASDYYYSPVSDYDGPVVECEGKNDTQSQIVGAMSNGYSEYYYHQNCHKATFAGSVCPSDSGYHASYSPPAPKAPAGTSSVLATGAQIMPGQWLASPNGVYNVIYQGDGNVVMYDATTDKWATNTYASPTPPAGGLVMQNDCNLVLYQGNNAVWTSNTAGRGSNCRAQMQDDGNFVVYEAGGDAVWSSMFGTSN